MNAITRFAGSMLFVYIHAAFQGDGDPDGLLKSLEKHRSEQRDQEQRDWHRLALKKTRRKRILD
jgi:hypothetical protein